MWNSGTSARLRPRRVPLGCRRAPRLAREHGGSYRPEPVQVGVRDTTAVSRLGLIALIGALDGAAAHDATDPDCPDLDVLVVADPAHAPGRNAHTGEPGGTPVPTVLAVAQAVRGRDVLRHLREPVRGVVMLSSPPPTWACAIAGVAAGGYVVDPVLTRNLVLLAAAGTPYGPRPLGLTAQQQRILDRVGDGLSNRAIARDLGVSPETVKSHLAAAMRLLDARDRSDAARRLAVARAGRGEVSP